MKCVVIEIVHEMHFKLKKNIFRIFDGLYSLIHIKNNVVNHIFVEFQNLWLNKYDKSNSKKKIKVK